MKGSPSPTFERTASCPKLWDSSSLLRCLTLACLLPQNLLRLNRSSAQVRAAPAVATETIASNTEGQMKQRLAWLRLSRQPQGRQDLGMGQQAKGSQRDLGASQQLGDLQWLSEDEHLDHNVEGCSEEGREHHSGW
eukprot:2181872-Rhodomonas_salina.2